MTYEVETRGGRRTIEVRHVRQQWEVTVDGRTMAASVTGVGDRWSLLIGPPEGGPYDPNGLNGGAAFRRPMRSYEVSLDRRPNGDRTVYVNGLAVPVSIVDPRARLARRSSAASGERAGTSTIVAPMPGRIVKVLVKAGDRVLPHQGLVVVEAMKMENELRASRAGTVTDVRVGNGMSVDAGAVLIVMDFAL